MRRLVLREGAALKQFGPARAIVRRRGGPNSARWPPNPPCGRLRQPLRSSGHGISRARWLRPLRFRGSRGRNRGRAASNRGRRDPRGPCIRRGWGDYRGVWGCRGRGGIKGRRRVFCDCRVLVCRQSRDTRPTFALATLLLRALSFVCCPFCFRGLNRLDCQGDDLWSCAGISQPPNKSSDTHSAHLTLRITGGRLTQLSV
jgi:hypothetical protein